MDATAINTATLLQRRKKSVHIGKTETLLILRSYVAHPTKWGDIIENVKQNVEQLPPDARELYQSGTAKQLRGRMFGKLGKLMAQENIADADIREAVLRVKELERRLVRRPPAADVAPSPPQDIRDNIAAQMSDVEPDDAKADNQPPVLPQAGMNEQRAQRIKKRPLANIRENQLEYNKFIKKKFPKLMRQLGVSSDDSDSN